MYVTVFTSYSPLPTHCSNAGKFVSAGGLVDVDVRVVAQIDTPPSESCYLLITVSNSRAGPSRLEDVDRLFVPFGATVKTASSQGKGELVHHIRMTSIVRYCVVVRSQVVSGRAPLLPSLMWMPWPHCGITIAHHSRQCFTVWIAIAWPTLGLVRLSARYPPMLSTQAVVSRHPLALDCRCVDRWLSLEAVG